MSLLLVVAGVVFWPGSGYIPWSILFFQSLFWSLITWTAVFSARRPTLPPWSLVGPWCVFGGGFAILSTVYKFVNLPDTKGNDALWNSISFICLLAVVLISVCFSFAPGKWGRRVFLFLVGAMAVMPTLIDRVVLPWQPMAIPYLGITFVVLCLLLEIRFDPVKQPAFVAIIVAGAVLAAFALLWWRLPVMRGGIQCAGTLVAISGIGCLVPRVFRRLAMIVAWCAVLAAYPSVSWWPLQKNSIHQALSPFFIEEPLGVALGVMGKLGVAVVLCELTASLAQLSSRISRPSVCIGVVRRFVWIAAGALLWCMWGTSTGGYAMTSAFFALIVGNSYLRLIAEPSELPEREVVVSRKTACAIHLCLLLVLISLAIARQVGTLSWMFRIQNLSDKIIHLVIGAVLMAWVVGLGSRLSWRKLLFVVLAVFLSAPLGEFLQWGVSSRSVEWRDAVFHLVGSGLVVVIFGVLWIFRSEQHKYGVLFGVSGVVIAVQIGVGVYFFTFWRSQTRPTLCVSDSIIYEGHAFSAGTTTGNVSPRVCDVLAFDEHGDFCTLSWQKTYPDRTPVTVRLSEADCDLCEWQAVGFPFGRLAFKRNVFLVKRVTAEMPIVLCDVGVWDDVVRRRRVEELVDCNDATARVVLIHPGVAEDYLQYRDRLRWDDPERVVLCDPSLGRRTHKMTFFTIANGFRGTSLRFVVLAGDETTCQLARRVLKSQLDQAICIPPSDSFGSQ